MNKKFLKMLGGALLGVSLMTTMTSCDFVEASTKDCVVRSEYSNVTLIYRGNKTVIPVKTGDVYKTKELKYNNYDFEGWYYDEDYIMEAEDELEVNGDITIYAKFTESKLSKIDPLSVIDLDNENFEFKDNISVESKVSLTNFSETAMVQVNDYGKYNAEIQLPFGDKVYAGTIMTDCYFSQVYDSNLNCLLRTGLISGTIDLQNAKDVISLNYMANINLYSTSIILFSDTTDYKIEFIKTGIADSGTKSDNLVELDVINQIVLNYYTGNDFIKTKKLLTTSSHSKNEISKNDDSTANIKFELSTK